MFNSRFVLSSEEWFFRFLSLSLIALVIESIATGAWWIHSGAYFPWRHPIAFIPLYPTWGLLLEWGSIFISALFLLQLRYRRVGIFSGTLVMFISVLQRFSNHSALIFMVLFYLALAPRKVWSKAYPVIRYQLMIVYLFSALNKIDADFLSGNSLKSLGVQLNHYLLPPPLIHFLFSGYLAQALSLAVIGIEFLLPIILLKNVRAGLVLLILFHASLCMLMPDLFSFSFIMIAMGILFIRNENSLNGHILAKKKNK